MKIGFYGGSFDPIHNGHIRPVWEAKRALGLDRVLYLPTARPPHKPDRRFADAHHRFAMVELALLWESDLYASSFELRQEVSYTIDTIRWLRARHPDATLVMLVGSDAFAGLATWRAWQAILEEVEIGVLLRPGWSEQHVRAAVPETLARAAFAPESPAVVRFVSNQPVEASSTEVRRQLAESRTLSPGLVPSLVLDYIRKYDLYRSHHLAAETD